jgi:hypothetical protein
MAKPKLYCLVSFLVSSATMLKQKNPGSFCRLPHVAALLPLPSLGLPSIHSLAHIAPGPLWVAPRAIRSKLDLAPGTILSLR